MAKRKIIEIDRDLCNGCGLCTTACAEGALQLDEEGKAVLVRELYCDGMGACLSVCPTDALKIIERDSEEYDATAAYTHVLKTRGADAAKNVHGGRGPGLDPGVHFRRTRPSTKAAGEYGISEHHDHSPERGHEHGHDHGKTSRLAPKKKVAASPLIAAPLACGCPGTMAQEIKRDAATADKTVSGRSELSQWPVQLHLVSPFAPYFQNADLLVAADCTAFALGSFHQDLLKGKKLVIACPKLDDTANYVEKLSEILKLNAVRSVTVAIMTVPCCAGLWHMVQKAVAMSGSTVMPEKVVVGIDGSIAA